MPRIGRLVMPGYPHHIVQRGHNRQVIFVGDADYRYYLNTLDRFKKEYGVKVYAYCLMTNHVHLLLEPECVSGLAGLMKRLAGRQTRYFNKQEGRRGSLWEGRYKSSVVDTANYLMSCIRYIELNPVKAKMVASPSEYEWSSYNARCKGEPTDYLDPIPDHDITGKDYEAYIGAGVLAEENALIQRALERNQLTGGPRFIEQIENITGKRLEYRGPGRPRREKEHEK